jgi:hypothetical protein
VKLKTKRVEEIIVPPLPEYSYVCNGEIVSTECKGSTIFRDPDFITIQPQDVLYSFSLSSIVSLKARGRKFRRWSHYLNSYHIQLEGADTSFLLSSNGFITIYVDGLDFCGISGDVVYKEYKVITTKKDYDQKLEEMLRVKPHLAITELRELWISITGYKVIYIDSTIRKELERVVGVTRIECNRIEERGCTTICEKR